MPSAPYNGDGTNENRGLQLFKIIENLRYIALNPGTGGGGAGDASAANQATQIGIENSINGNTASILAKQTDGTQKSKITDGTNDATISTSTSDGVADAVNRLRVSSAPHAYNGATWDKIRSGFTNVASSVLGYLNCLPFGKYNATPSTLTDGQSVVLQMDANGRVLVTTTGTVEGYLSTFSAGTTNIGYPTSESLSANKTSLHTEPLGLPLVARQLAAGSASSNTALTTTCRRISIRAVSANIRFAIGSTSQTANASTSHYIAQDERLDIALPSTPNIAVIRAASTDGTIELTELA